MSDPNLTARPAPGAFSPSDAAFEGFRLARREPRAFLAWALLSLVVSLLSGVALVGMAGPAMMQLQALRTATPAAPPAPAAVFGIMAAVGPAYLVVVALSLVFYAVMNAAVLRAVLRPQERRLAYLRFGAAELRQLAVLVLLGLVFLGVYIALILVLAAFFGLGAVVTRGAGGGGGAAMVGVIVLVELVAFVAVLAAMLFIGVRLSLASAHTFATGRVRLFGSWGLTRRRFWPLLGAYVLAGVMMALMLLVLMVVTGAIAAAAGGAGGAGFMFHPDMTSLAGYFQPLQVVYLLITAPLTAFWVASQAGVPAAIYAQIAGSAGVADVFGPAAVDRSTTFGAAP